LRRDDLGEPVLERVIGAVGARIDLPFDRLADAQLVSAALVASAFRHAPDGVLCIELGADSGGVDLRVGPLAPGAAAKVVAESALPGVGVVLERLVDEWSVDALDSGEEMLRLRIGAGAPTTG
jgi:serine/threonine-protein kinase RsbW